jgi:hypothetical protein
MRNTAAGRKPELIAAENDGVSFSSRSISKGQRQENEDEENSSRRSWIMLKFFGCLLSFSASIKE